MITAKGFLSILLVLTLCVCACACNADGDSSALEQLEGLVKDEPQKPIELYRVIISASASSGLAKIADELARTVEERTGVRTLLYYDNEYIQSVDSAFDILVGNPKREEMASALEGYRRDDYICKMTEKCLILGALSDNAAITVTERYINEVLSNCDGERISDFSSDFEYHHGYEIDSLTLCGFDISDYVFVCAHPNGSTENTLMYSLREKLADRCGAYPDVLAQKEQSAGVKEIILKTSESAGDNARISYDGEDVVLTAKDSYGLSLAAERLLTSLFSNVSDGKASLDITETSYSYVTPKIALATVVTSFDAQADVINAALTLASSVPEGAEAVLFGAVKAEIWNVAKDNVRGFAFKSVSVGEDEVIALAFDESEITCGELALERVGNAFAVSVNAVLDGGQNTQICFFVENSADSRSQGVDALKQSFADGDAPTLAVYLCADTSSLDVSGGTIATCQNITADIGDKNCRIGAFCSVGELACEWGGMKIENDICSFTLQARKILFDGSASAA